MHPRTFSKKQTLFFAERCPSHQTTQPRKICSGYRNANHSAILLYEDALRVETSKTHSHLNNTYVVAFHSK